MLYLEEVECIILVVKISLTKQNPAKELFEEHRKRKLKVDFTGQSSCKLFNLRENRSKRKELSSALVLK